MPKIWTKPGVITQKQAVFQQYFHHKLKGTDDQLDVRSKKNQEFENDTLVLPWVTWRMQIKELFWD